MKLVHWSSFHINGSCFCVLTQGNGVYPTNSIFSCRSTNQLNLYEMDSFNCRLTEGEEKFLFNHVFQSYVENKNLIVHQIDSYNKFLDGLHNVFESTPPLTIKPKAELKQKWGSLESVKLSFGHIKICKPTWTDQQGNTLNLLPMEARLRKMTYNASIYADIKFEVWF